MYMIERTTNQNLRPNIKRRLFSVSVLHLENIKFIVMGRSTSHYSHNLTGNKHKLTGRVDGVGGGPWPPNFFAEQKKGKNTVN